MLNLWKHTNPFEPGTTVRADHANFKLDGIEASFESIAEYLDSKMINLPASFTGNAHIPNKTLNNAIVWFNTSGDIDVYSMTIFEQKVTDTAANAASALDSKNKAKTSADNARQSEINAASSAELAQGAAVTVAGAAFFAGLWNASTGSFPAPPALGGSSIWMASSNGTGATAAVRAGDLIIWDIIAGTYRHFAGAARVIALEAQVSTINTTLNDRINYLEAIALAGNKA